MTPTPTVKKKKPKFAWREEDMLMAIKEVREKGMNAHKASHKYGVPRTTLLLKLKLDKEPIRKRLGPECTIGEKHEKMLANWIEAMVGRGFPITALDLVNSVKKIVEGMNLQTKFKDSRPGRKWFKLFLKRHGLAMRTSEKLTSSRASVKEENIRKWFAKVNNYMEERNLNNALNDPTRVFNMDESGFLLCPKGERVLAIKGQRNVYQVCSNNEKESITVLLTVSAAGRVGPSLVVYPGQRYPKGLENFLPDNWAPAKTEKGWITGEVFFEYIANVFHKWLLENNVPLPVVLFLDGHSSHLTYHLSDFAAENGIEIIALHPNATHILQPLDVSVFGPLKKKYAQRVNEWKIANNTLILEKVKLPMVLDNILQEDLDQSVIINGFRVCGLHPFSPDNVDYSKCVVDHQLNSTQRNSVSTIDIRHEHLEKLLGAELVCKFKGGAGDESPLGYAMWLKSKEICFGSKDHEENLPDVPQSVDDLWDHNFSQWNISDGVEPPMSSENALPDAAEPPSVSSENDLPDAAEPPSVPFENALPDAAELPSVSSENVLPNAAELPSVCTEKAAESPSMASMNALAKVLSPETGGVGVPSPIKRALHWPGTPKKKNARRSLAMDGFPVITSEAFRAYKVNEKKKKIEDERLKEEKKLKREEMKKNREIKKQEDLKNKGMKQIIKKNLKEKRRFSDSDSSNSDAEVTSGESVWDEAESSDDDKPKWQPLKRQEGEYVVVKYEKKYFPGKIQELKETGAMVSSMEASGRLWKWPENEDKLFFPWKDIVSHIATPTQTSKTRKLFAVNELEFQNQFVHL